MRVKYYYVYILRCSDETYYTGFSNEPDRRLQEHNEGLDPKSYTFHRRPVNLVYTVGFSDPVEGISFEKQLKGWSRKKKEALIRNDIILLKKLSLSYRQIRFSHAINDLLRELDAGN